MTDDAVARIDRMMVRSPQAVSLARLLSFAVLIEPALLRATRLELLPRVDAGAEADLWFGPLVQTRSRDGVVLYPAVAEMLRTGLQRTQAEQSWRITKRLHEHQSPAVQLEESLNWLSTNPENNALEISRLLQSALTALLVQKRSNVANWAGRALPRLPEAVRTSEEGTMLAVASDLRLGRSWTLEQHFRENRIPDWAASVLPDNIPKAELGIALTRLGITFDPTPAAGAERISLPATDPRVVELSSASGSQIVFVEAKTSRSVPLSFDDGRFELTTLAGQAFTLERDPTAAEAGSGATLACTAYANGNQALIAWQIPRPIKSCLGFALERTDADGDTEVLKSLAGFQGPGTPWVSQPTTVWPVQRFGWMDRSARRGGRFSYTVTPVVGTPGKLEVAKALAVQTNSVDIGAAEDLPVAAYFNPQAGSPRARESPDDPGPRRRFGGEIRSRLLNLLATAKMSRQTIYAALWILDDPDLIEALAALGKRANVLLTAGPHLGHRNVKALKILSASVNCYDGSGTSRQRHNSFMVVCDHDTPRMVWTGSVIWTSGGLYGQDSNALLIQHPAVARNYVDRWHRLRENPPASAITEMNSKPASFDLSDGSRARLWSAPVRNGEDLADIRRCLAKSRSAILFAIGPRLRRSVVDDILALKDRYVAGVARMPESDKQVTVHQGGTEMIATADGPTKEVKDLLDHSDSSTQPPIGSRLIVIDPFDNEPVVITGSHFLSAKASRANEEDLVIIQGNAELAAQCAVHIKGLIDHYRFRARMRVKSPDMAHGLRADDGWQEPFMTGEGAREIQFWMGTRRFRQPQAVAPRAPQDPSQRLAGKPTRKSGIAARSRKAKMRAPFPQKPAPASRKPSAKRPIKRKASALKRARPLKKK